MSLGVTVNWHAERRRRNGKVLSLEDFYADHTDTSSAVDKGETTAPGIFVPAGPRFVLAAGHNIAGNNKLASVWEYFNQDPWADPTRNKLDPLGRGDAYFGCPLYVSANISLSFTVAAAAGMVIGVGIGASWPAVSNVGGTVTAGAEAETAHHISLRYEPSTTKLYLVVINHTGAVGQKKFTKDLGTAAALGLHPNAFATGVGMHLEVWYYPNRKVEGYVDGTLVGTFTDADSGGGNPLAGIFANRNAVGSTIKGSGCFAFTGPNGGVNAQTRWIIQEFHREVIGGQW